MPVLDSNEMNESVATVVVNPTSDDQHSSFANKAIPLVLATTTANGTDCTLQVSDIAAKLLQRRTSNKVAVVSIFGEAGTGKSFLLNQLLKVPQAFEVQK